MNLFLIDGSSYLYRAFHALPPLTRPSDNLPVGAVYGFCNMIWQMIVEGIERETPTHLAVVFDNKTVPNFRANLYPAYKATRGPVPDDLRPQFELIRAASRAFGMATVEQAGFEADDIIATYARLAVAAGGRVLILAADKDLMQLVSDDVHMFDTMRAKRIDPAGVMEKFGVSPASMIDFQALVGDSVDNVPGVPGIGPKTAAELLQAYGDLEGVLYHIDDVKQPKRRASLLEHRDNARLSKQLCTLDRFVPVDHPLDSLAITGGRDYERLLGFCRAMEFVSITERIASHAGIDLATLINIARTEEFA